MSSSTPELNHIIVRAGAGAGKTTALVETICRSALKFYEVHQRFPKIMVTTFTRKATQELRERLVLKALESENENLLEYVTSTNKVAISTIHGILNSFLSQHGHRIGLVSNFQIVADAKDLPERKTLTKNLLLSRPEYAALLQDDSFANLVELLGHYTEKKILNPKLSSYSKSDLEQTLVEIVGQLSQQMNAVSKSIETSTENEKWLSFAGDLAHLAALDSESVFGKLESWKSWRAAAKRPRNAGKVKPVPEEVSEDVGEVFAQIKKIVEAEDSQSNFYLDLVARTELFAKFADEWIQQYIPQKLRSGFLRQGDLELISHLLIEREPESARQFSAQFDQWYIDEFQDTSPLQVRLFERLIAGRPKYIVGDPQQSIYLFRGARTEVFQDMWEHFQRAKLSSEIRMKNYRSSPELMTFINDVVTGVSDQFAPMEPRDTPGENKNVGCWWQLEDLEQESLNVSRHVVGLLNQGVRPDEIAILTRKRSQMKLIAKDLMSCKVPYQVFLPSGFFDRREIIDALNLLKFLCQPHDDENLIGLLRSPWFKLPDEQIFQLCKQVEISLWSTIRDSEAVAEIRDRLERAIRSSQQLGIGLAWQHLLIESGLFDTCKWHDLSGRREANLWKLVSHLNEAQKVPGFRYVEFVNSSLNQWSAGGGEEQSDADSAFEPNRVSVMTVHKSKGLQFSHVIIPFTGVAPRLSVSQKMTYDEDKSLFCLDLLKSSNAGMQRQKPLVASVLRKKWNDRELGENLRLLYVALTRAKQTITLTSSKIEKNSWGERLQPIITQLSSPNYQFEISDKLLESEPIVNQTTEKKTLLRSPWSSSEPSNIEKSGRSKITTRQNPVNVGQIRSATKGTRLHRVFELLKYHSRESLELIGWSEQERSEIHEAIDYLYSLDEIPFAKILQYGYAEWGFSYSEAITLDSAPQSGQIDLWANFEDKTYVIDYKTGDPTKVDLAMQQLAKYAKVLVDGGLSEGEVVLVAIYPFSKKIQYQRYSETEP